ncbi:DUF211 domain-containing protein [Candidatus Bathyarchaeota archaeon]|nr:DUF211 domain-containing protein [Candidatus Bathyarchaeota archaeon]
MGGEIKFLIKKLVLDVLKPREPPIYDLAAKLTSCQGVNEVNILLAEIDQNTESIKVSITGDEIDIETIKKCVEEYGASIHSIDEVTVAKRKR